MIESFIEYMWYLFTTPFKKARKSVNKWFILCRVFGKRLDEAKEGILRARDEGMAATCCPEMLPVHGAERQLTRYAGELAENYRSRIAMYEDICMLGGTNEGVLLAVKTLGYRRPAVMTAKDYCGDTERWAEFYIVIIMELDEEHPISRQILKKQVRKVKEVGAKDNYVYRYQVILKDLSAARQGTKIRMHFRDLIYREDYHQFNGIYQYDGKIRFNAVIPRNEKMLNRLFFKELSIMSLTITVKQSLWLFDGTYSFDGTRYANASVTKEKIKNVYS